MLLTYLRRGGWLAALLIGIGGVAIWVWQSERGHGERFARIGETVEATIVGLDVSVRPGGSGRMQRTRTVEVTYVTGDALGGSLDFHRASETVSADFFAGLAKGDRIPVRVMPDDPEDVEIEPGGTSENAFYAGLVGLFFALMGLGLGWLFWRNIAALRRLAVHGVRAEGQVVAHRMAGSRLVIDFKYRDATGQTHKVTSAPQKVSRYMGIAPGDPVEVVYDPDVPEAARLATDLP